jgi:hypothetical protein
MCMRGQLRKHGKPFDGRRGLKRLCTSGIVLQPVIIIAGNDDLFVFVPLTERDTADLQLERDPA